MVNWPTVKKVALKALFIIMFLGFAGDIAADSVAVCSDTATQTCHVCVCSTRVIPETAVEVSTLYQTYRYLPFVPCLTSSSRSTDIFHPPKVLA